jgi:hypothetical protein
VPFSIPTESSRLSSFCCFPRAGIPC